MIIAMGLYQGFTALDAIGPYEVLAYLPGTEMVICAEQTGVVDDHNNLVHPRVDTTFADVPRPDVLLAPGGPLAGQYAADGPRSWTGSVRRTRTPHGQPLYAPAHYCSAPPGCLTECPPPPTGAPTTPSPPTAPSRPNNAWSPLGAS